VFSYYTTPGRHYDGMAGYIMTPLFLFPFLFSFFFVAGYIMAPSQNLVSRKRAVALLEP